MRVAYLVPEAGVSGGVRVILAQADALTARGHDVTLVTEAGPVTWRATAARWRHVGAFEDIANESFDFVVGTFWTTVVRAYAIARERAIHLCQGYEGAFTAYQEVKNEIDAAYRLPIPKITVSRHLVAVCRRFFDDATHVGQIVDDEFFRDRTPALHDPTRVLLCGPAQADMKGIDDGYAAIRRVRQSGLKLHHVRVSAWAPPADEPLHEADEFHVGLTASEMTRLMHECDVLLAPNHSEEGFGLPAAEALASRIPTVLTEIPSYLGLDERRDYAMFARERDAPSMGDQLTSLLRDASLRERVARRGREVAEQFRAERVGERIEAFFSARARTRTSGR